MIAACCPSCYPQASKEDACKVYSARTLLQHANGYTSLSHFGILMHSYGCSGNSMETDTTCTSATIDRGRIQLIGYVPTLANQMYWNNRNKSELRQTSATICNADDILSMWTLKAD